MPGEARKARDQLDGMIDGFWEDHERKHNPFGGVHKQETPSGINPQDNLFCGEDFSDRGN